MTHPNPQPWQQPQQPPAGQQPWPPYGQQPYAGQPYGQQNPYGQPQPGQTPFGTPPPPHVDINQYAPPKQPGPMLWIILGVAVLAMVLIAGFLTSGNPLRAPAPTATPTPSTRTTIPTHTNADGLPFTMPFNDEGQGRWKIVETTWNTDSVTVRVRIKAEKGSISYGFIAFTNNGEDVIDPSPGPGPELTTGSLRAGESVEGNVTLDIPRENATLILTTSSGRQMSALPIKA